MMLNRFVWRLNGLTPSIYVASWAGAMTLVAVTGLGAAGADWRLLLTALGLAALLWCRPVWVLLRATRDVLKAGYGRED